MQRDLTNLRILIKMPNWVGDCVMTTPAIALLKAALPTAEIHALCRYPVSEILETNPHLSGIVSADDRRLASATKAELKKAGYDVALMFTNTVRPAWIMWRAGIRTRIGFARGYQKFLLTKRLTYDPLEWQSPVARKLTKKAIKGEAVAGRPRHMVMYYLRIVEECLREIAPGVNLSAVLTDYRLVLPVAQESRQKVRELLRENQLTNKRLIGLNPGAAHGAAKRWPPERLGHVANALVRPDFEFVTTASKFESDLTDLAVSKSTRKIYRLGEKTALRDLPALIEALDLLITNDSGPMHIAAAVGTPVLSIFGPTDWPSTHPWMAAAERVSAPVPCSPCFARECPIDHPCMQHLSSYDVASEALRLLNQTGKWKKFS